MTGFFQQIKFSKLPNVFIQFTNYFVIIAWCICLNRKNVFVSPKWQHSSALSSPSLAAAGRCTFPVHFPPVLEIIFTFIIISSVLSFLVPVHHIREDQEVSTTTKVYRELLKWVKKKGAHRWGIGCQKRFDRTWKEQAPKAGGCAKDLMTDLSLFLQTAESS